MNALIAELLGTMLLILLGNGVVANVVLKPTKGHNDGFVLITIAWGLAVYVGVLVAGPHSGAHINPAVSISLAIAGKFAWSLVPYYIVAQVAGAAAGMTLVWLAYHEQYKKTDDDIGKLATFCTIPEVRKYPANFTTEAIGTFVLVFAVLFIAEPEIHVENLENARIGLGSLGALPVALIVVVIGMSLGGPTGYAINPARDLAPRFMHQILPIGKKGTSDWPYAWIPILAPIAGGAIASLIYMLVLR